MGRTPRGQPLVLLTAEPKPQHRHVALALRDYIQREEIALSELSRRVGTRAAATSHPWAKGSGAVGEKFRAPLARLLGVPTSFLAPWDGEGAPPNLSAVQQPPEGALGPVRQARALVAREAPRTVQEPVAPATPVLGGRLSYEGHGDGTASIRVQARLPLAQAKPLFRVLMDSGIDLEGPSDG